MFKKPWVIYEVQLRLPDSIGDKYWEPAQYFSTIEEAERWYDIYAASGQSVRIVKTELVKSLEKVKENFKIEENYNA